LLKVDLSEGEKMKAYAVTDKSWHGLVLIYAAETRAKAIYLAYQSKLDAGYDTKWTDFRAKRIPMYDRAAVKQGEIGSDDGRARGGCLADNSDQ
jgi:hypothetical protein